MFRMVNRSFSVGHLTALREWRRRDYRDVRPSRLDYFISLKRMMLCGAGGSDDTSTDPFSGGRS